MYNVSPMRKASLNGRPAGRPGKLMARRDNDSKRDMAPRPSRQLVRFDCGNRHWDSGFSGAGGRWTGSRNPASLIPSMTEIVSLISRHGYVVIAAVVFAEAIGLPVPAALALVAAGAAVGSRVLQASVMLPLALAGMMLGDTMLFVAGRYTGWSLLGFLCKVSANPETCILRSAESFYKR